MPTSCFLLHNPLGLKTLNHSTLNTLNKSLMHCRLVTVAPHCPPMQHVQKWTAVLRHQQFPIHTSLYLIPVFTIPIHHTHWTHVNPCEGLRHTTAPCRARVIHTPPANSPSPTYPSPSPVLEILKTSGPKHLEPEKCWNQSFPTPIGPTHVLHHPASALIHRTPSVCSGTMCVWRRRLRRQVRSQRVDPKGAHCHNFRRWTTCLQQPQAQRW